MTSKSRINKTRFAVEGVHVSSKCLPRDTPIQAEFPLDGWGDEERESGGESVICSVLGLCE